MGIGDERLRTHVHRKGGAVFPGDGGRGGPAGLFLHGRDAGLRQILDTTLAFPDYDITVPENSMLRGCA
jgi:hypothetical protein